MTSAVHRIESEAAGVLGQARFFSGLTKAQLARVAALAFAAG